jgi:predicted glycosyltransferase involved in capsule biosynthesis
MALTTFGAVMGFAAEMAANAEETYKALQAKTKDPALVEILRLLSLEEGKNHALMVKARRENVTEMILEPITGFNREEYEVGLKVEDRMEDGELLKAALALEERGKKFFQAASSKVPLPEVARIFRKIAKKKEDNLARLQSLRLPRT